MHGIISKETMNYFVRTAKILDTALPIDRFAAVDFMRVSMAGFIPSDSFPKMGGQVCLIEQIPQTFIKAVNDISDDNGELMFNGVNISPLTHTEGCYRSFNNKQFEQFLDTKDTVNIRIQGTVLKGLLKSNSSHESVIYYRDSEVSLISIGSDFPVLILPIGDKGEGMYCKYPAEFLRKLSPLIPSREVTISFKENYPCIIQWDDSDGNRYILCVAPKNDGMTCEDAGKLMKSQSKIMKVE